MFKNKKLPEQSNREFLTECGIKENSPEAILTLKVRMLLSDYAQPQSKIKKPEHVFAHFKIEDELEINHVDSLHLVDIILDLEKEGISISEDDGQRIFELNKRNATVSEIINGLLNILKEKHHKTNPK